MKERGLCTFIGKFEKNKFGGNVETRYLVLVKLTFLLLFFTFSVLSFFTFSVIKFFT